MKLLLGADVVPTQSNNKYFCDEKINDLIGRDLFKIWGKADIRIFNLEAPLVEKGYAIMKTGLNLKAPIDAIKGIKQLNPSLITLANNHILDHGAQGLESTINLLKESKIPFVGAGKNLVHAQKPFIIEKEGKKIGVYACAEHEFSIAKINTPGANPFDSLESLNHIQKLKEKCDFVIVLYHGGKEHYQYPSPKLQKVCHKIIENGADLILCQHSHVIGCYELYLGGTIVYGQGNFIFDLDDNELWNTGLLVEVNITDDVNITYIPFIKSGVGIELATGKTAKSILDDFEYRSLEIKRDNFLCENYEKLAKNNTIKYLTLISGYGKWISRLDRHLFKNKLLKRRFSIKKMLMLQNYIECETHNELFLEVLRLTIEDKKRKF